MSNGSALRGPWGIAALVLGAAALIAVLWVSLRRPRGNASAAQTAANAEIPASVRDIANAPPAVARRRAVEETCRAQCTIVLTDCELRRAELESAGPSCADQQRACIDRCVASTLR